jgi:hypothetical protein
MEQITFQSDNRLLERCVFCGVNPETLDNVPPAFFLDDPLPRNLPRVPACYSCNNGASKDEEYLGCLLEVVRVGSANSLDRMRLKVQESLSRQAKLAGALEASKIDTPNGTFWESATDRVTRVVIKLAKGHAAFELSAPKFDPPDQVQILPLIEMPEAQRKAFESAVPNHLWPEVGSRAMIRAVTGSADIEDGWVIVQSTRYRYLARQENGIVIRIVISEYLACEVIWGE